VQNLTAPIHAGAQRLFILIAGLWVGGLLTVGYLVAPTIFNTMTDRQVAGMVAGSIFGVEAYLSTVVSVALMILANLLITRGLSSYKPIQGMPVMLSPSADMFAKLHGASSVVFLIQSALGIYLVWRLTKTHPL